MKRLIILSILIVVAIFSHAQSKSNLESRTKTTKAEKRAAQRSSHGSNYSRYHSSSWDVDNETWGIAYSYSPNFPIALSANYTTSYFSIGGEIGAKIDGVKYSIKERETAKPFGYFLAIPGFYCKYFSINCGVGILFDNREKSSLSNTGSTTTTDTEINIDGSSISASSSTATDNQYSYSYSQTTYLNFCFKPSITGYIPLCDEDYYITINAGYIFVPKIKDLNGFTCGIGFQVTL